MNIYPALTISLLSQLTDRELQSNYLNHLNRTVEIANLLTQITDKDLALRIVNLALDVDLCLGASLTSSIDPALQQIIVDRIDSLEIPTRLKIELWRRTKSNAALSWLQDIFAVKNQYRRKSIYDYDFEPYDTASNAIDAIIEIDPKIAVSLLIENLDNNGFYSKSLDRLAEIAIADVDADAPILTESTKAAVIDNLASQLDTSPTDDYYNYDCPALDTLAKIGTGSAIDKIRDILNEDKSLWLNPTWIQGLGMVGETPMIEHLLYLLYFAEEYIDCNPDELITKENESDYERKANTLRCEAILGIERLGGDLAFNILHQSLYRIANSREYPNPWGTITQALFRLNCDRILTSLEQEICDRDPAVQLRAVNILGSWYINIDDRHLSILLNAIEYPDLDVRDNIAFVIRSIIRHAQYYDRRMAVTIDISPQLLDLAKTNPTFVAHDFYRELATKDIGDKIVQREFLKEGDRDFIKLLNISQLDSLISDVDLIELIKDPDYIWSDFRAEAIVQMGEIGDALVLPKLIALLEDPERSIGEAAVEGIVQMGTVATLPTLLSLATHPELVMKLVWYLEELRKKGKTARGLDLLREDRQFSRKFLDIAEKTIVDIAIDKCQSSVMAVLCLGAIGSTNEAVLTLDKIIKDGYHHYNYALRSLARIDNELAIGKISEYLLEDGDFANHMGGELRHVYRLGIIPHLWKCERNHYSGTLSDIIATIQKREGLYNPDFSDRSHPLFEPSYPRLRQFLLGDANT
jgi:HEAT repeat protein